MEKLSFFGLETSSKDLKDKFSLILYTKKCMLACHGCHNRKLLNGWDYKDNNYKRTNIVSVDNSMIQEIQWETIKVELESGFYDAVILCGGEITIHPLQQIINTIKEIRNINKDIIIRIDTNCIFPEKMEELKQYIDGFACDIKFPYWSYGKGDGRFDNYIEEVLGVPLSVLNRLDIPNKMLQGLHIAKSLKYTSYRTVLYPFVDNTYFDDIKQYTINNLSNNYSTSKFVYI